MASSLQQDSISFFQKLLRMFLNAFALRPAPNLMMSLMQRLLLVKGTKTAINIANYVLAHIFQIVILKSYLNRLRFLLL